MRPVPAGVRKPSTRPATTSQTAVPSTISTAARASTRNASDTRARARVDDRRREAQARDSRHDDATQLEHTVRDDELEERPAVARADREARDRAEQDPVLDEHVERAETEQHAAREREERHLDVVGEDVRPRSSDSSSTEIPRLWPEGRGSVTDWYELGTRPPAAPGSRHAQ